MGLDNLLYVLVVFLGATAICVVWGYQDFKELFPMARDLSHRQSVNRHNEGAV